MRSRRTEAGPLRRARRGCARTGAARWLVVVVAGCAFAPGDPWGVLSVDLVAEVDAPEGRRDGAGRWLTANDYALEVEALGIDVGAVWLEAASAAEAFDPANPPEGYSLCHGGHCHADDGRLVPYDAIAAEGGASTIVLSVPTEGGSVDLVPAAAGVPLLRCGLEDPCEVERMEATRAVVGLAGAGLRLRAFDRRQGTAARLPEGGVAFTATLPLGADIGTALALRVDEGEPLERALHATLRIPAALFDGVDWAAIRAVAGGGDAVDASDSLALSTALTAALTEGAALAVAIEPSP